MRQGPWWRGTVARCAYVVIGAGVGLAVSLWSSYKGTDQWIVWASLAIGLTAAGGAVFGYGLARWPEIVTLGLVRPAPVVTYLALLAATGLTMFAVSMVPYAMRAGSASSAMPQKPFIGIILVTFTALTAVPVVAGLAAIRDLATTADANTDHGQRIETLLDLRRLLAGFLPALGAQVTLATLALGASPAQQGPAAGGIVIVFGAWSSLLMAIAYVPAAGAVHAAARELSRALLPLAGTAAADLPARLTQRRELDQAVGLDRGLLADLQSGVVVLAPLLASAAAAFLPN